MNYIYESCLKHVQIKAFEQGEKIYVSRQFNENAHVAAEPSDLAEVISFHQENFSSDTHVLAETEEEAQIAISSGSDFTLNGVTYQLGEYSTEERYLLQLRFSSQANADRIARSYVAHQVMYNYTHLTQDGLLQKILSTGAPVDVVRVNGFIRFKFRELINKVHAYYSIPDKRSMDVRHLAQGERPNIGEMAKGGTFIDSSATGWGKTETALELMGQPDLRSLYVSHRRSIVARHTPGVTHYDCIKPGTEKKIPTVKTVVNSIDRPQIIEFMDCAPLDVLVIDEVAQVLSHIATGVFDGPRGNNRISVFETLCRAIKKARTVYVADAHANEFCVRLISSLRLGQITLFETDRNLDACISIESKDTALTEATQQIYHGRAFVATDDKRFVDSHVNKGKKEGVNILGITGDNIEAHRGVMENPHRIFDHDGFLFSPAITSSFSITKNEFTGCFGLFRGVIHAGDALQMLRRNRPAREFIVSVSAPREIRPDRVEDLLPKYITTTGSFDAFAAEIEATENFIKNNNIGAFEVLARMMGFKVKINTIQKKKSEKNKAKSINNSARKIEEKAYREALLNASPATRTELVRAVENGETTEFDQYRLERAMLEETIGTDQVNDSHIRVWGRGSLRRKVEKLEIAMLNASDINYKMYMQRCNPLAARDQVDYAAHHKYFNLILSTLNIDLTTLEGSFNTHDANRLRVELYACRDEFNKLEFVNKRLLPVPPRWFTKNARDLLNEFGLELDKGRTSRGCNGGWTRRFNVTSESAENMRTFLANRQAKGLGIR